MSLQEYHLAEHATQLGEIAQGLIRMEGMKAENDLLKFENKPPKYVEEDFHNLLSECGLWHNSLSEKTRRF